MAVDWGLRQPPLVLRCIAACWAVAATLAAAAEEDEEEIRTAAEISITLPPVAAFANFAPPMYHLTDADFDAWTKADVEGGRIAWFVVFTAPWCKKCQDLDQIFEELGTVLNRRMTQVKLGWVDASKQRELAHRFEVRGFPTLVMLNRNRRKRYIDRREVNYMYEWLTKGHRKSDGWPVPPPLRWYMRWYCAFELHVGRWERYLHKEGWSQKLQPIARKLREFAAAHRVTEQDLLNELLVGSGLAISIVLFVVLPIMHCCFKVLVARPLPKPDQNRKNNPADPKQVAEPFPQKKNKQS